MSEDSEFDLEQIEDWGKRTFAKLRKELRPGLDAVLRKDDGTARLLAISDEEWQAAAEKDEADYGVSAKESISKRAGQTEPRRSEEIEMTCPLCGHNRVMRYPYREDGWQHVCQGCRCAFDPEIEC